MKEEDIRPQILFDELLRLNREDIKIYFDKSNYTKTNCPACGNRGSFAFNKNEFNFEECEVCKTLYVSPRPDKQFFDNYYTDSESTKYWATTFYKATQDNRRKKLWEPKAKLIHEKISVHSPNSALIIDIGGGYGVFIEEFLKLSSLEHLVIEPSKYLSEICREKKLNVLEKFLEDIEREDIPNKEKTFVSFELFEHLHDPRSFLEVLSRLMNSGDTFIFTTLSSIGVDIQTLWEDSKAISPPMHLNFFNPKSISTLLEDIGYKVLEVSTPGKLDIDIMNNNKDKIKDRFWRNFMDYSDEKEKENMQTFLSKNGLSSHMMIVCQKI